MKMEPVESIAEKKMKNELISVQEKLEIYEKSIKQLRDKMEYQRFKVCSHLDKLILSLIKSIYWYSTLQIDEHKFENEREIHLGDNQVATIKENLKKTSREIAELVKIVNSMKKQLNIVDT